MRIPLRLLPAAAVVAVLAGTCGGPTKGGAVTSSWPMYHLDPGRSGDDTGEPSFAELTRNWSTGDLDGAVYAEPLVDGSDVIVVTENDSIYAFDAAGGNRVWGPVHLGAPRTSNFPCGDIDPLGITGTPVIDNGSLFVVAEVQTSSTQYQFNLARLNPGTGAVAYNVAITPSGMDTNTQQQRSALGVSNGNVVVEWGGLDGDCGTYHGYVETAAESNGAVQAQWHDTTSDNEGGIWGPSGPAVDSAGNIYVSTGNGSNTSQTQYDYGDSVLRFTPSLGTPAFFAPGQPQPWWTLNADDTDLGSVGPELLPNGLLFAIGKGGRGYLLSQSSLPNDSNPGGGENYSASVCAGSWGGMASAGSVVYIPCDGSVVAVNIDSSTHFHTLWQSSSGGGAPIVAGGLVWSGAMFGGSTLYGLNPANGAVAQSLSLPESLQHFATPSSCDGELFVPDGSQLIAYRTQNPAPPGGGYVADGWGGVHPYGGASNLVTSASWPGWDIVRGLVMRPDRESGYVLDGWGGVHPYGLTSGVSVSAWWPHWDIARAIVLDPCDSNGVSGYVLDGFGGIHPFGGAPAVTATGKWNGWDIARSITVNACSGGVVNGYVLDGWGGVHPFWQTGTAAVPTPVVTGYWPGWDIARGIVATGSGQGYVADGLGNVHPYGGGAAGISTSKTNGADIIRGITFNASMHGGYLLDAYGHVDPWWIMGSNAIPPPSITGLWSFPIARGITQ